MLTIGANSIALCVVLTVLLVCCAGQTIHGYLRSMQIAPHSRTLSFVYESALLVHLMIMAAFVLGSADAQLAGSLSFLYASVPLQYILWINVALAVITLYMAVAGIDDDLPEDIESAGLMAAADTVLILLCTPAAISMLGDSWLAVLYVDTAYFLFRTCFLLIGDMLLRRRVVSQLSVAEAVKLLPEGLLYADKHGHTLIANDAMRHCLSAIGFSADFGKVGDLWKVLNKLAEGERAVTDADSIEHGEGNWVILNIGPQEARLFSFEGGRFDQQLSYPSSRHFSQIENPYEETGYLFGEEAHYRVIAYDVTESVEILKRISQTNAELEASQQELRAAMLTLQEAAENEAMLRMRGRVHDVIGQRLSMLHRALEDEDISDERLEQLKPLLNGILDDLSTNTAAEPADELAAIVSAFGMTEVDISVKGDLPADPQAAKLFVECIREGATNAVKHAHATVVTVSIEPRALHIANNGLPPEAPIVEGTGLTHMRQAVQSAGGTLTVDAEDTFALTIRLP